MSQSKKGSLIETSVNIVLGFILSVLVMAFIIRPIYGYHGGIIDDIGITAIFTVVSFIRGYFLRRYFNKYG